MNFTETEIALFIQQYFLPFCRLGMMFMVMPIMGSRITNPRVRLALAFLCTLLVVPLLPPASVAPSLSLQTLVYVVQEIALGALVGFSFQVVFQVFVLAGQLMAMKMGLGFASMNDPTNGVQTTVISQFFLILVTLTFVSINGHLVLLSALVDSFTTLPIATPFLRPEMFQQLAGLGAWMFASALVIALPVITSLLFVNIAFGVMSRAAPQLNIFAVGFPFTLICGLLLIWLGLGNFLASFDSAMDYGFYFVHELLSQ